MVKAEERLKPSSADNMPQEISCPPMIPALPMIDDDTLDKFLTEPNKVERLPVKPHEYRREFQRLIVSAFLHDSGSITAA
jgi:hypothetical protein